MPDRIRLNEGLGIIEVDSYGSVTKEDIAGSISGVRRILEEKGINRILVDTRGQEAMPGTVSIFELFSRFPLGFKVALLVKKSQPTSADQSFVETVAVNRGIQIQIFHRKTEALEWLDQG